MSRTDEGSIQAHFSILRDPRIDRTKRHKLIDIVSIAICGVICGADNWVDIELFGNSKKEWLETFLDLPNGIPSHDTFGDVFARMDPVDFQTCFVSWVSAVQEITRGQVIGVDGKTVRRSHDRSGGKSAIHMVSAWASANHLVLGQTKVDEKSNEITAIPELLRTLSISGCIITIDAMGCQREIAETIIKGDADYVLAVKENQAGLYERTVDLFKEGLKDRFVGVDHDYHETISKGHGRIETRRCWVISDDAWLAYAHDGKPWAGLNSLAMVSCKRQMGTEASEESRFYISSLSGKAEHMLEAVRGHWSVENSLHWVLDMVFREDESRIRKGHGPENFAVLRHIAINLIKKETTSKGGVKARRNRAGWDNSYLLKVLNG